MKYNEDDNKYEFVERLAMKKKNPQKNLIISWIVIGAGIFFATTSKVIQRIWYVKHKKRSSGGKGLF